MGSFDFGLYSMELDDENQSFVVCPLVVFTYLTNPCLVYELDVLLV